MSYCFRLIKVVFFFVIVFPFFFNPLPYLLCVSSIRSVMQKYLEERDELTFDKVFNQKIGKSRCGSNHPRAERRDFDCG